MCTVSLLKPSPDATISEKNLFNKMILELAEVHQLQLELEKL